MKKKEKKREINMEYPVIVKHENKYFKQVINVSIIHMFLLCE